MKDRTEILWIAILLAIIVAVAIFAVRDSLAKRNDCEERGGTVVKIHNSQTGEWFCQEPHP